MQNIIICSLAATASMVVQSRCFVGRIILRRYLASVILILPLLPFAKEASFPFWAIASTDLYPTLAFALIFSTMTILVTSKIGRHSENTRIYRQVRTREGNVKLLISNALSWTLYLTAYEFLFRGYLFYSCLQFTTVENAFIIGVVAYSLAHLFKSEKEFLLSVPFGGLLCYITFVTNNVWAAVAIHLALALSYDMIALQANPYFTKSPITKKLSI
jgi:membrane protease YdiL (CAAX protease family)